MRITVVKGAYEDRILICFWIGSSMQTVIVSPTELESIMEAEDIRVVLSTPIGIWKLEGFMKLVQ